MGRARGGRWRKLRWVLLVTLVADAIGWLVARRMTSGHEGSDEFQVAAICWGKQFHSHATNLRAATALALMGGLELDLRQATLDPNGATVEANATMGGIQITVPDDWAVHIEGSNLAGGVDVHLSETPTPSPDAPTLTVITKARMGGIQILNDSHA